MRRNLEAGESAMGGILVLAVLIIVILTLPRDERQLGIVTPSSITSSGFTYNSSTGYNSGSNTATGVTIQSAPQARDILLGSGNASYAYQSYEEYITIDNIGTYPVNITGWQLRNGKDRRSYNMGGSLQRFSADIALIPQAVRYISPSFSLPSEDIILAPGDRAIVTTGSVGVQTPYKITSFKENICSGYLEASPDYAFTPPLTQNCPYPKEEWGIENLEPECRDFISNSVYSCQEPRFGGKDLQGYDCPECVNGKIFSSECTAFLKERYNYQGCLAYHKDDANFSGRTWRIFLGRGWEMWAKDYESIELFNQYGQLVDYENY